MLRRWGWAVGLVLVLTCGEAPRLEADSKQEGAPTETEALALASGERVSGDVLDIGQTKLTLQPWAMGPVSVASDGEQYFAVWQDRRSGGIYGTRVRKDGTVLDPAGLVLDPKPSGVPGAVTVGFDGTNFLVVWFSDQQVLGTRVTRDGKVMDADAFLIATADSAGEPAMACDAAGRCLVVILDTGGEDANALFGAFVVGGTADPAQRFLVSFGEVGQPRVAWTGQDFLVVWHAWRDDSSDVLGTRVAPDGTLRDADGFVISAAKGNQRYPDVGRAGDALWVVWEDTRRGKADIFGARVRGDGTVLDADGVAISTASGEQREPRVADEGARGFVLWTDVRDETHTRIRGARVNHDGSVINRAGFPVSSGAFERQEHPALACLTGQCLTVFEAPLSFPPYHLPVGSFVMGTRLTMRNGALDSPALELSRSAPEQQSPAVAWGGDSYLVVWQEFRDVAGPTIRAARVRRDGTVLDADGLRLPSAPGSAEPAVAFDGSEFLVVWQEPHSAGDDIRGARVSPSGGVLDSTSLAISTAPVRQLAPSVAGGDGRFLVAWEDSRDSALFDERFSIFGARVSGTGQVLDTGGRRLSPSGHLANGPDVVHLGDRFLVAWLSRQLEGTRVAYDGTVMDAKGLALSPPTAFATGAPALAFDGKTALVVWPRYGTLRATRVTPEGTLAGPPGFLLSNGTEPGNEGLPDVAFDGVNPRAVWLSPRPPTSALNPLSIYGTRVAKDGTVLDAGGVALLPEVDTGFPVLAPPALAGDGGGGSLLLHTRFIEDAGVHSFRLVGQRLGSP